MFVEFPANTASTAQSDMLAGHAIAIVISIQQVCDCDKGVGFGPLNVELAFDILIRLSRCMRSRDLESFRFFRQRMSCFGLPQLSCTLRRSRVVDGRFFPHNRFRPSFFFERQFMQT